MLILGCSFPVLSELRVSRLFPSATTFLTSTVLHEGPSSLLSLKRERERNVVLPSLGGYLPLYGDIDLQGLPLHSII